MIITTDCLGLPGKFWKWKAKCDAADSEWVSQRPYTATQSFPASYQAKRDGRNRVQLKVVTPEVRAVGSTLDGTLMPGMTENNIIQFAKRDKRPTNDLNR